MWSLCNWINKEKAEEVGYRVFIVPGSSFAKRILKENKCKAVLGVACYRDLNISMMKISNLPIVTQGVPLLKDGCFKLKSMSMKYLKRLESGKN